MLASWKPKYRSTPSKEGIYLFVDVQLYDTTLRDGAQTEGISFSVEDKIDVLKRLDAFGIDFVEGGIPGSNPKDMEFFRRASRITLEHTKLVAFGFTRRKDRTVQDDPMMKALLESDTQWVCVVGKSSERHAKHVLSSTPGEYVKSVRETIEYLKSKERMVFFDAEHFFDGWKENKDFAESIVSTAVEAGADCIVLCDTNGGCLPFEVSDIVKAVRRMTQIQLGVHMHNDAETAVANSIAAVEVGVQLVQGTINGLGERCGNANLCSLIPALSLKMKRRLSVQNLHDLTSLSKFVYEVANLVPDPRLPYVGSSAFAHKAGIHIDAVLKNPAAYEHVNPEEVGNVRHIVISELTGISGILSKVKTLGVNNREEAKSLLEQLKRMEFYGYQFEGAEASLDLLIRRLRNEMPSHFRLEGFRVLVDVSGGSTRSEAIVKVVDPRGEVEHTASDGNGPVNALDRALRKALVRFFPEIQEMKLIDYKVRVIDTTSATAAKVRVLIKSTDGSRTWATVGVSTNIIEASLQALLDSIEYKLLERKGKS
ncbi:MAG: citramalate synthase [Methanomassiliicoccales archaeon]